MAKQFNLTAQLNLRAPNNLVAIRRQITNSLAGIPVNIKFNIPPNLNRTLISSNAALAQFNTNLNKTVTSANNASAAITALAKSFDLLKTSAGVAQINKIIAANNVLTSGVKSAIKPTEDFAGQIGILLRRFSAFAIGATGFVSALTAIKTGVSEAVEFQNELVRLSQVTNKPLSALQDISKEIGRLSAGFGVSSKELSGVATTLAQAGFKAEDLSKALDVLAKTELAPTFDGIKSSTEGLIAIQNQFGFTIDETAKAFDALNAVAAKYAVESGDIIEAVKRSGAAFSTAGGDFNEFISLFTSVRQTTRQSAETIATGFNTIFTRLQRPKTIDFLKKLNIELEQGGKFVGPYEAIKRLSEGLANLDTKDVRFSQINELLGGYRQIPKIIPLLKEFSLSQEAYNTALSSTGSLTKDQLASQQSFYRQLISIKEAFLELIREIGNNKTLQDLGQVFLGLAKYSIEFARALEPLIPALTAVAGISIARGGRRALQTFVTGKFARGGVVPGQGHGDTVPAMLTPGEFVINKRSAQTIGYQNLEKINGVQKFARGGVVKMAFGGKVPKIPFTPLPDQVVEGPIGSAGGLINSNINALYKQAFELIKAANPAIEAYRANAQAIKQVNALINKYGNNLEVVVNYSNGEIVGVKNLVQAQINMTRAIQKRIDAYNKARQSSIFGDGNFLGKGGGLSKFGSAVTSRTGAFIGSSAGLIASSYLQDSQSVAGQATSGALSGAAFGSVAGPIGIAGGAALGGLISYFEASRQKAIEPFVKSLQEASDRINKFLSTNTVEGVNKAFEDIQTQIKDLRTLQNNPRLDGAGGRIFQGTNTLTFGLADSIAESLGFNTTGQALKEQQNALTKQFLPNIITASEQSLRSQIRLSDKPIDKENLDPAIRGKLIDIANQRVELARASGQKTDVGKELNALIKEIIDPANLAQKQKEAVKRLEEISSAIDQSQNKLLALADVSTQLGREFESIKNYAGKEFDAVNSALNGGLGGPGGNTEILRKIGVAPRGLVEGAINDVTRGSGISPEVIGLVKDLDKVERDLPSVVRQLVQSNPISDENGAFTNELISKLGIENKDLVASITNSIEKVVEELGTDPNAKSSGLEKLNKNPDALIKEILGNNNFKEVIGSVVKLSELQDEKIRLFAETMGKTVEVLNNYNKTLAQSADLTFERDKLTNRFNKGPASAIVDNRVLGGVNRLAGTTDPTKIANRIIEARREFNQTPLQDISSRAALKIELDRLTQALSDLGDVTKRTQTDFEKLDEAASKTEAVRGLGRNFFGADLQGRFSQLRQLSLVNQARQSGSLDQFNISDQQSIVEALSGPLSALFPQLLDQLISNTSGIGKVFAEAQGKFAQQEKDIQNRILQTYDSVIQSNNELARIQLDEVDSLKQLNTTLDIKIASLLQEITSKIGNNPQPVGKAKGGFISRGTDTVPAMLTPGEYVVNAKSAQKNAGLLHQINYRASGGPIIPEFTLRRKNEKRIAAQQQQKDMQARINSRRGRATEQFQSSGLVGDIAAYNIAQNTSQALQDINYQRGIATPSNNSFTTTPIRQRREESLSPRQKALEEVAKQREADRQSRRQARIDNRTAIQQERAQRRGIAPPAGAGVVGAPAATAGMMGGPGAIPAGSGGGVGGSPTSGINTTELSKLFDNFASAVNKLNGAEINLKVQDIKVDLTGGEIIKGLEEGLKQVVGNAIIDKINSELIGTDGKPVSKFGQA